ncbi:ribonuclease P protein component [Cytophagales bacterium LB-30]|uniref:Ribonuclease P protein component n=1 Tax=Shiella aurantiaca TaxID=3058365 RepID=A0ABT8F716_9BACT|nr:ribonuclease P protein component [Shiella aurantiaca]MDN4166175.1 ribonuclease P protein component [Shiella aurantiaca]
MDDALNFRFTKAERLSSKKKIEELFAKGSSIYLYPFRLVYIAHTEPAPHQLLISVSKRNFKKAVDRNRIKRLIRETYRTNKHLLSASESKYRLALIYTAKEIPEFKHLNQKLIEILSRLKNM